MIFPKHQRFESPETLAEYCRTHPVCEVGGCTNAPMPTPHHLRSRKMGGGDEPTNLIRLCWWHHVGPAGWHRLGRYTWFTQFGARLLPDARAKVEAVLRPT